MYVLGGAAAGRRQPPLLPSRLQCGDGGGGGGRGEAGAESEAEAGAEMGVEAEAEAEAGAEAEAEAEAEVWGLPGSVLPGSKQRTVYGARVVQNSACSILHCNVGSLTVQVRITMRRNGKLAGYCVR